MANKTKKLLKDEDWLPNDPNGWVAGDPTPDLNKIRLPEIPSDNEKRRKKRREKYPPVVQSTRANQWRYGSRERGKPNQQDVIQLLEDALKRTQAGFRPKKELIQALEADVKAYSKKIDGAYLVNVVRGYARKDASMADPGKSNNPEAGAYGRAAAVLGGTYWSVKKAYSRAIKKLQGLKLR